MNMSVIKDQLHGKAREKMCQRQRWRVGGERNVRIVPDVAVNGASGNTKLVDGLLGVMLRSQSNGHTEPKQNWF
jgi:hypothetical protein